MPSFIIRRSPERAEYLEWSTVVDAPISRVMDRQAMLAHLHWKYGHNTDQERRIERCDQTGTSSYLHDGAYEDSLYWREGRPEDIDESPSREVVFDALTKPVEEET